MKKILISTLINIVLCINFVYPFPEPHIYDKQVGTEEGHYVQGKHNPDFDHTAFLGDEASTFDSLTPEESRRRLSLIFDKIDRDHDGFLNSSELTKWIQWTQRKYIISDGIKQWKLHNPTGKDKLPWEEYKKATYGFLELEAKDSTDFKTYNRMMERDKRRWLAADQNEDGSLTLEEFQNFLHPEDIEHMKDVVIIETIEDIDKNADGKISLEEYISDLYRGEPGDEEPEWIQNERETFIDYRDKDKDGFLNHDEVKEWVMPDNFDQASAESAHLIHSADINEDSKLTKEEVLDKYEVFVGSQATDFGEALIKHEEF